MGAVDEGTHDDRALVRKAVRGLRDDHDNAPGRLHRRNTRRRRAAVVVLAVLTAAAVIAIALSARPAWTPTNRLPGGSPVTWDACTPIRFVVNPRGAPGGAIPELRRAAADISRRSGLRLEYAGTTTARPGAGIGLAGTPVLVAWTGARDELSPLPWRTHGQVQLETRGRGAERRYVAATVLFNAERAGDTQDFAPVRFAVRHELGHLVGLDHVDDPREVMFPLVTRENRSGRWGPGDAYGLRRVGRRPNSQCS